MDVNIALTEEVWTRKEVNYTWKDIENYILLCPCGFTVWGVISTQRSVPYSTPKDCIG